MKLISQHWKWEQKPLFPLQIIEDAGRTCYQSNPNNKEAFTKMLIKMGHHSVIEHVHASIRIVTNRGVTHELVRHRLASFSQESTRYVSYKDMEFIKPVWWHTWGQQEKDVFKAICFETEIAYKVLIEKGNRPEQAREILPNALKTEIVMTANLREWRHVFFLRCSKKAHPQMRELIRSVLKAFKEEIPVVFDDIEEV